MNIVTEYLGSIRDSVKLHLCIKRYSNIKYIFSCKAILLHLENDSDVKRHTMTSHPDIKQARTAFHPISNYVLTFLHLYYLRINILK